MPKLFVRSAGSFAYDGAIYRSGAEVPYSDALVGHEALDLVAEDGDEPGPAVIPTKDEVIAAGYTPEAADEIIARAAEEILGPPAPPADADLIPAPGERIPAPQGKWNRNPADLAGLDLETLLVMVFETDSEALDSVKTVEEAIALLSKDYRGS